MINIINKIFIRHFTIFNMEKTPLYVFAVLYLFPICVLATGFFLIPLNVSGVSHYFNKGCLFSVPINPPRDIWRLARKLRFYRSKLDHSWQSVSTLCLFLYGYRGRWIDNIFACGEERKCWRVESVKLAAGFIYSPIIGPRSL